jgi:hypothetical protein
MKSASEVNTLGTTSDQPATSASSGAGSQTYRAPTLAGGGPVDLNLQVVIPKDPGLKIPQSSPGLTKSQTGDINMEKLLQQVQCWTADLKKQAKKGQIVRPFELVSTAIGKEPCVTIPRYEGTDPDKVPALSLVLAFGSALGLRFIQVGTSEYKEESPAADQQEVRLGLIRLLLDEPIKTFEPPKDLQGLTRWKAWVMAARAVANKQKWGSATINGDVIPDQVNDTPIKTSLESAIHSSLSGTTQMEISWRRLMLQLVEKWANSERIQAAALALIKNQKISWSAVMARAWPQESRYIYNKATKKRVKIVVPKTVPKPNISMWLTRPEKDYIAGIPEIKEAWQLRDQYAKDWKAMTAPAQHAAYKDMVSRVRACYHNQNRLSDTYMRRIGMRKNILMRLSPAPGLKNKPSEEQAYYKSKLAGIKNLVEGMSYAQKFKFWLPTVAPQCDVHRDHIYKVHELAESEKFMEEISARAADHSAPLWKITESWIKTFKITRKDLDWPAGAKPLAPQVAVTMIFNRFEALESEESG